MRIPSPSLPRWAAALALGLLAAGAARADLIFMEDGFVLQGTLRRESTSMFDKVAGDFVVLPKGFTLLDEGPRRIYFSPTRVRIVEQMPAPAEERVYRKKMNYIIMGRTMPPHLGVNEVGAWNYKTWERDYWFDSSSGRVGVKQALARITPQYAQVDAITKFKWSSAYLTSEWPVEEVVKLLKASSDFQPDPKAKPAVNVYKRLRLADFF